MRPLHARREEGQVLVMFALALIAILAGSTLVFDVGNQLIQRRMAQDGADAAALAGGHALAVGATSQQIADVITSYAGSGVGPFGATAITIVNAYFVDANDASLGALGCPTLSSACAMPATAPAGVHVDVSRKIPATFSNVLGIGSFTATGVATGATATSPVDIMIALDTTGSMGVTGFAAERKAVHDFVLAMKLKPGDANSVRIGMARFQGSVCSDTDSNDTQTQCHSGTPWDDATILSPLTDNPDNLITIACGPVGGIPNDCLPNNAPADYNPVTCSSLMLPSPFTHLGPDGDTIVSTGSTGTVSSGHVTPFGCPLTYIGTGCCPGPSITPAAWNEVAGTKLANAFNVVQGKLAGEGTSFWWWADATRPTARKILIMMTDGQDNSGGGGVPAAPATIVAAANSLKTNTNGNVTIYTLGYYGGNESTIAMNGTYPYPCIGATFPPPSTGVSATDTLMHDLSSSALGDCEFYSPLKKTDSKLPEAFVKIAGKIQQGRLTH